MFDFKEKIMKLSEKYDVSSKEIVRIFIELLNKEMKRGGKYAYKFKS